MGFGRNLGLIVALTIGSANGQERPASSAGQINWASSRQLSLSELQGYLKDRKVALFGETHVVTYDGQEFYYLVDDMHFRNLLPTLKMLGYTHVALEIEYKYEERVRRELKSIHEAMDEIGMTGITIAPPALKYGLEVMCIDNRDAGRVVLRDEYMEQRIATITKSGGRVAYYVGSGHLQLVHHSPEIAGVELNPALGSGSELLRRKIERSGAKPLAQRLVESYGAQGVAIVSIDNCDDSTIPFCFK